MKMQSDHRFLIILWFQLATSVLYGQTPPIFTVDQNASVSCEGWLYDSGGPNGDYGNNEYHVFQICPTDPPECLVLELTYYDIEFTDPGTSDQLLFYDGPEVNPSTLIAALGGSNFSVGTNGGGGVCYRVAASSGCLTIQFASDGMNSFSGFEGRWYCQATSCPEVAPLHLTVYPSSSSILDALQTPSAPLNLRELRCDSSAYGLFANGLQTELGLGEGVLLTTGEAAFALGPNDSEGFANFFTADRDQAGDANLDSLSLRAGSSFLSEDACVLELDVSPNSNALEFAYVFGSEEYPEYVLQEYNDIFAFLVSGPGITGSTWLNNQRNIATLPDGTVVEINSVNNQVNWPYFRNNNNGQAIQYDGLTADSLGRSKTLIARTEVQPCSTYTLKLAIADRGDGVFDSGVFVGKIRAASPRLDLSFANGLDRLTEDCELRGNELTISYDNPSSTSIRFTTELAGTAILNVDYSLNLPASLEFPPGQTNYTFPLDVLADEDIEDLEDIRIILSHDFGCGTPLESELIIEIEDSVLAQILAADTLYQCPGIALSLAAAGRGPYRWYADVPLLGAGDSVLYLSPERATWVYLHRELSVNCISVDSVFIDVFTASELNILTDRDTFCRGDSTYLLLSTDLPADSLQWYNPAGEALNAGDSLLVKHDSGYYRLHYNANGCTLVDSIWVQIDSLSTLVLPTDTLLCPEETLSLAPGNFPEGVNSYWTQLTGIAQGQITTTLMIGASEMTTPDDQERIYQYTRSLRACLTNDTLRIRRNPAVLLGLDTNTIEVSDPMGDISLQAHPEPLPLLGSLTWSTAEDELGAGLELGFSPEFYDYPPYVYLQYEDDCQELLDSVQLRYLLVQIPNFFSPNGDGTNDVFRPFSPQPFDYYELIVYNRWGQQVFNYQGKQPPIWDGRTNNQPAPADLYIYRAFFRLGERTFNRKGNVSLVR